MSTNINGAYQKGLGKVREGLLVMQAIDKQRNLDAFLERQQRIKERHSKVQNTGNPIAATATANADTSEIDKEVNHV